MSLLIIANAAVLLLALVLLGAGFRGRRVDDHPICRRCGFDLFGLPAGSQRCSECGADLARRRAVRTGRRERRTRLVTVGAALLLPATLGPAVYIGGAVTNPARFGALKPDWLLMRELDADFAPATRDAAFVELENRLIARELDEAQLHDLAERALARQADPARPWVRTWGQLFEAIHKRVPRPPEQVARFYRQQLLVRAEVVPRVLHGGSVVVRVDFEARFGFNLTLHPRRWDVEATTLTIGPVTHAAPAWRLKPLVQHGFSTNDWDFEFHLSEAEWARLPVGSRHDVRLSLDLRGRANGVPLLPYTLAVAEPVEIGAPVPLRTDPALRQAVADAMGIRGPGVDAWTNAGGLERQEASLAVAVNRAPIGLAFDVSLRAGGREWPFGTVHFRPGVPGTMLAEGNLPLDFTATRADVVFRPSQSAAARNADLTEIWGELVVFPDQPVGWAHYDDTPRTGPPPPATQPAAPPASTQPAAAAPPEGGMP